MLKKMTKEQFNQVISVNLNGGNFHVDVVALGYAMTNMMKTVPENMLKKFRSATETLNIVCGSGLNVVNSAARLIQSGDDDIVIAGGTESVPFALKHAHFDSPMINIPLVDTMVNDGLWDAINDFHMGITAENVVEKYGLTREELERFAVES